MDAVKQYGDILEKTQVFAGISREQQLSLLPCLGGHVERYESGRALLRLGQRPVEMGMLLGGRAHILKASADGTEALVAALGPGDVFAETLCCAGVPESPVTVMAVESCTVLLMRYEAMIKGCPKACGFHQRLLENMLQMLAQKNLQLQHRMDILALKTLREKVLEYLQSLPKGPGGRITLPLNRERMAAFLGADRSALSHELMRMKADGLISYRKNEFVLGTGIDKGSRPV